MKRDFIDNVNEVLDAVLAYLFAGVLLLAPLLLLLSGTHGILNTMLISGVVFVCWMALGKLVHNIIAFQHYDR